MIWSGRRVSNPRQSARKAMRTPCAGESNVVYNEKYRKYVKVVPCSHERYYLFMGEVETGPF